MKRSIIPLLTIHFFYFQTLQSQDAYEDVVYLKNGNFIRGMPIEFVPGKSITILASDHNEITFDYAEIEKVRRELKLPASPSMTDEQFAAPSVVDLFQMGVLTSRARPLTTFKVVHGVQFADYYSFGLGVG